MSVISMTGYGKSESVFENASYSVEIRSVNNRFLDITCKLPKAVAFAETALKNLIKSRIQRGSVNVFVNIGQNEKGEAPATYSKQVVEAFLKISSEIQSAYAVPGQIQLEQILTLPGVLQYNENSANDAGIEKFLVKELDKAITSFNAMRAEEGKNLAQDLQMRIEKIESILNRIETLDSGRIPYWKNKFQERLKTLLADVEIDPVRIIQEASIIADRLDITEEIIRFRSHNKLFIAALGEESSGKKLGFILQEMGREANTLGTKCQNAEIAALAIQLKDEIETIREQTMNIE
ncbi:MAG: YicC family protein [Fibrobacter sp.]|nr:YicC family protein [Fibrobacter sp.]